LVTRPKYILRLTDFRAVAEPLREEWARHGRRPSAKEPRTQEASLGGARAVRNVVSMDDDASDDPLDGGGSLGSGAGVVAMETNAANIRVVVRCRPVLAFEAASG
jgi:hypothetical protein